MPPIAIHPSGQGRRRVPPIGRLTPPQRAATLAYGANEVLELAPEGPGPVFVYSTTGPRTVRRLVREDGVVVSSEVLE